MKKSISISIVLCVLLLLASCAPKSQSLNINLYYANKDNSQIILEQREIQVTKKDSIPKIALDELLKGPKNSDLNSNIPRGTKLLSVDIEKKIAKVNFSKDFSGFPGSMAESFAVISVVNTLTDLEEIEQVEIWVDGKELIAPSGEPYGLLEKYDIQKINKELNTETVTLYFPDKEAMYLVSEQRDIIKDEPIAFGIVMELMKGPESSELTPPALPKEAKLLSVEVKGDTAYVDFSKELKENHIGGSTGEIMTIYPIVNSLTELPEIDKVEFLIEGEKEKSLAGHLTFDEPFTRDESLIKK